MGTHRNIHLAETKAPFPPSGVKTVLICLLFLAIYGLGGGESLAQNPDSPLRFEFSRQNNFTFGANLDGSFQVKKGKYSGVFWGHHDQILNNSNEKFRFIQVTLSTTLWQYWELNPKWALASWVESENYFTTENHKACGYLGIRYKPFDFLTLRPLLGYAWDVRSGIVNHGISPALFLEAEKEFGEGFSTSNRIFSRYKSLDPRRQINLFAEHQIQKEFFRNAAMGFALRLGRNELDDFAGASEVKRIISDTLLPQFSLQYPISKKIQWESQNKVNLYRRSFVFEDFQDGLASENNLNFKGFDFSTIQNLHLNSKNFQISADYGFELSSRNYELENSTLMAENLFSIQKNMEARKDYLRKTNKLDLFSEYKLRNNFFQAKLANQYLMYDTPSEDNNDDRDELTWGGEINWKRNWRPEFRTQSGLSGNFRHYAFLLGEKSQDNYIQRSLRLDFSYDWSPFRRWKIEGTNALYVTYNVKDFADLNKTNRSTRNLETNGKITCLITPKLHWKLSINRKEIQLSYLDWMRFAETTLDTTRFTTIETNFHHDFFVGEKHSKLSIELGYKHFYQSKRKQALLLLESNALIPVFLKESLFQTGPALSISGKFGRNSFWEMGSWFQAQIKAYSWKESMRIGTIGAPYKEVEIKTPTSVFRPFPFIRIKIG